eukprot:scaffold211800_cov18-Prasinocladus_malaysianus.AAC.1
MKDCRGRKASQHTKMMHVMHNSNSEKCMRLSGMKDNTTHNIFTCCACPVPALNIQSDVRNPIIWGFGMCRLSLRPNDPPGASVLIASEYQ